MADGFSSASVIKKSTKYSYGITEKTYREIEKNPHSLAPWLKDEIKRLAKQYQFFHWHLEFPSVFKVPGNNEQADNEKTGFSGGFDCVLGNPPWERIKLQEKEFFASSSPEIANAPNAAKRRAMIAKLPETNPELHQVFVDAKRRAEGESHLVRDTDYFPLCGRGDINTYSIFAELMRNIISIVGRVGCIVPSGIATDDTTKYFFQDLVTLRSLVSLYSFENEEFIFPQVHHATKFCLITMAGSNLTHEQTDFVFFARQTSYLKENNRHFNLSSEDIKLLNPNTRTCPIFHFKDDAELTKFVYRSVPVLINEDKLESGNQWGITFSSMYHMTNDSALFHTKEELEGIGCAINGNIFEADNKTGEIEKYLPLYEGKMIWHYDNRFGTHEGQTQAQANQGKLPELSDEQHRDPYLIPLPRYWIRHDDFSTKSEIKINAILSFRVITSSVVLRTAIFCVIPFIPCGNSLPIILFEEENPLNLLNMASCTSSFIFDYITRQKMGGSNMNYFIIKQLPVLQKEIFDTICLWDKTKTVKEWLLGRVLELIYTSWDLYDYSKQCGHDNPPFEWNKERRYKIRAELDAAYFYLYLGTQNDWNRTGTKRLFECFPTPREALEYVMDTFRIVKEKEEKEFGKYRTKELILEIYDKMTEAIATGTTYQTILDIPAGPPCDAQGNFIPMSQWDTTNWPAHIHRPKETEVSIVQPAGEMIQKGKVVLDVLALLYAWEGKRVDRLALETGLILMQHDSLRKSIITNGVIKPEKSEQANRPRVQYMDDFLAEFNGSQFVLNDSQFIQTIEIGPQAESLEEIQAREVGAQSLERAKETVDAVSKIQQACTNNDDSLDILGVENVSELIIQEYAA